MAGNTLISPTLVRKVKLVFNYGILISLGYIFLTLSIDTRIINFEVRDTQTAMEIYNTHFYKNHIGKYLYKAYVYLLSDYTLNRVFQGLIIGFGLSFLVVKKLTIKEGKKVLRGAKIVEQNELINEINSQSKRNRIFIANKRVPLPYFEENRSILLIGKAGAGKTQAFFNLLLQIFKFNETMIIYDRKPDFWNRFYDETKDFLFYPKDERSLSWNIFDDIKDEDDIDFAIKSIIPVNPEAKDPFWDNASRDILKAVFLKILTFEEPSNKKLIDFLRINSTADELFEELNEIAVNNGVNLEYYLKSKNTTASILSTFQAYTNKLLRKEFYYEEGTFSVIDFISNIDSANKGKKLFLVQTANESGAYEVYFRLMIDLLIREIKGLLNNSERRIWIGLDEFQSLGKLKEIEEGLGEGRSKGLAILLGTQSLAKVEEIYGKLLMRSLFQLLSTKIVLQYDEPDGARFLSDFFGEQEVIEVNENRMVTSEGSRDIAQMQQKETIKKIFLGGEFATLRPLEAYIRISNFNISKITFKYIEIPDVNIVKKSKTIAFDNIYESVEEAKEELENDEKKTNDENKISMKLEIQETQSEVAAESINELAILQLTKGDDYER
ncbi:type IV secretion system DNA-binding domain-containing protein [Aliarcobacter butzleri]|uniref:type IV secretion system DNA-binding domain-containing protein n=1 Tax=Aliarcobacter butzleri TaxID=28197 RepID=UPI003AFB006D